MKMYMKRECKRSARIFVLLCWNLSEYVSHPVVNKQLQIMSNWKNVMSLQKCYFATDSHSDMVLCMAQFEDKQG